MKSIPPHPDNVNSTVEALASLELHKTVDSNWREDETSWSTWNRRDFPDPRDTLKGRAPGLNALACLPQSISSPAIESGCSSLEPSPSVHLTLRTISGRDNSGFVQASAQYQVRTHVNGDGSASSSNPQTKRSRDVTISDPQGKRPKPNRVPFEAGENSGVEPTVVVAALFSGLPGRSLECFERKKLLLSGLPPTCNGLKKRATTLADVR